MRLVPWRRTAPQAAVSTLPPPAEKEPAARRPPPAAPQPKSGTVPPPPAAAPQSPGTVAYVRRTRWKRRGTPDRPCTNCGDRTVGNFCPVCGQRKLEMSVSLSRMLLEALDDQFSLNSALPRTLGALFFRPGHLSTEYVSGRVARYIPPFRLYLVSSLVFFVIVSLSPTITGSAVVFDAEVTADTITPAPAQAAAAGADLAGARTVEARKDWTEDFEMHTGIHAVDSVAAERIARFRGRPPQEAWREVFGEFLEHAPTMMFVLLPVFAGVMKLIYWRRKRFYVEHFVFALHVHAFVFLTFAVSLASPRDEVGGILMLWVMLYIYLAMKRFYGQGWFRTGVKYVLLGMLYNLILGAAFAVTLLLSLLLL